MFKNIKLIGVIFLSVLLLTNCKKENKVDTTSPGELVFAPYDAGAEKDGVFDVQCDLSLVITHARVQLNNGDYYYPLTFELDGKLYTQSIKLLPGDYKITEFSLMDDMGTPNDYTDDAVVKATPMWNSDYADFVTTPIDDVIDFTIIPFEKYEFSIDVLCFIPAVYDNFGFEWFEVTPMTIREQCFFGDFCINDPELYIGTLYGPVVDVDEVAIFKIKVYRDGVFVDEFFNTSYVNDVLTYESPLCIQYADYDLQENLFDFELWIKVDNNGVFEYVYMHTWTFMDDQTIVPLYNEELGEDGVVEFVLGDCVVTPTDLLLAPWPWIN
jgi:hypothetical protein